MSAKEEPTPVARGGGDDPALGMDGSRRADTAPQLLPGAPQPDAEAEAAPEEPMREYAVAGPDWGSVWANESPDQRLQRVLQMALESGHPGIDAESRDTMLGFVHSGRFTHGHYIDMWANRLAEMGIRVEEEDDAQTQLARNAAAAEAAAAAAAEAAAELLRPKPPPHPRSLRLQLRDEDLGDDYTNAVEALVLLLPYATVEEAAGFKATLRQTMTDRLAYDAIYEAVFTATKYYGMYRARLEGAGTRQEFHFTDGVVAARHIKDLWLHFHSGAEQARRKRLAFGAQNLGDDFNETMELLLEQLWGADECATCLFATRTVTF